jgi:ribonuclease III
MGLKESLHQIIAKLSGASAGEQKPSGVMASESALAEDLVASYQALEVKIGYTFRDRTFLHNSLLHRSHIHVTGQEREQSNERLEFLGDAVLGLVANEELYKSYPDRSEGDLTKMKSLLVCGSRLSEVATQFDLGMHIRMSRSEAATGGRQRSSILADTTEALIGAVYLDGGLSAARGVIKRVVIVDSDEVLVRRSLRNYKSRLQELIQSRYKSPPRYKVISVVGPDHDRVFTVAATFSGLIMGQGEGRNKKTAEQNAAREALEFVDSHGDELDAIGEQSDT